MRDPVRALVHDHADINRRVLELGGLIRAAERDRGAARTLAGPLRELREQLFLHFAREEEGLFPFVVETLPDLGDDIRAMELGHDAICGALARMVHLASTDAELTLIVPLFHRFEAAYAGHAASEADVLHRLDARLGLDQRARLAALVEGL